MVEIGDRVRLKEVLGVGDNTLPIGTITEVILKHPNRNSDLFGINIPGIGNWWTNLHECELVERESYTGYLIVYNNIFNRRNDHIFCKSLEEINRSIAAIEAMPQSYRLLAKKKITIRI